MAASIFLLINIHLFIHLNPLMKRIITAGALLLATLQSTAQTATDTIPMFLSEHQTFEQAFDSIGSGLLPARIPYGVLYNRVMGWGATATLKDDTVTSPYSFYQAWWDMEHSRISPPTAGRYEAMRHDADSLLLMHTVPVIAIDYNYATLDAAALQDGRLSLDQGILRDNNAGLPPYKSGRITHIGLPLSTTTAGVEYTIAFTPEHFSLGNTEAVVQQLQIEDIGTGSSFTLAPGEAHPLTFGAEGEHWIKVTATLSDETLAVLTQLITVKNPGYRGTAGVDCDVHHDYLESAIPFKGYNDAYATTSFGDYHIFYLPGTTDWSGSLKSRS
jgi:hypothetical protein